MPAYLIDGAADIRPEWLEGRARIGVTTGALAPASLVRDVIAHLSAQRVPPAYASSTAIRKT